MDPERKIGRRGICSYYTEQSNHVPNPTRQGEKLTLRFSEMVDGCESFLSATKTATQKTAEMSSGTGKKNQEGVVVYPGTKTPPSPFFFLPLFVGGDGHCSFSKRLHSTAACCPNCNFSVIEAFGKRRVNDSYLRKYKTEKQMGGGVCIPDLSTLPLLYYPKKVQELLKT